MIIRVLLLAAAAAGMLPARAAETLTLDQALVLASDRSQAARAARAGMAGASEAAKAAGQLPDPVLSVGIDNMPVTGPDRFRTAADFMTMRRIGVSQEWLSSRKRELRRAAAQAQVGKEAASGQTAVADARLQTALAFVEAYYAGEALKLTRLTEHHVHEEVEAAKARLQSSAGGSQEVLASTAARGVAEDESAEALQAQASALVSLQRWTGKQPDTLAAPSLPPAPAEAAYVAAHPAVLAQQRDVELARAEASLTATNRKPNSTWQVSYGQRAGLSDMVSLGVNIPLPVAPAERQDRETAAKLGALEEAEATLEETIRMVASEYRALASDAQRLGQRVERYRAAVVTPEQQRTQAALAGYRSNQVTLMTLFEARHAHVETQRKLLNLQKEHAKAIAQLAFKSVAGGLQ